MTNDSVPPVDKVPLVSTDNNMPSTSATSSSGVPLPQTSVPPIAAVGAEPKTASSPAPVDTLLPPSPEAIATPSSATATPNATLVSKDTPTAAVSAEPKTASSPAPVDTPLPSSPQATTAPSSATAAPNVPLVSKDMPSGTDEGEIVPDTTNLYLFGLTEGDRARLIAQTFLFSQYLRQKAPRLVRNPVNHVLDLGCGEGQLSLIFHKLYPEARIVGIDQDAKAIEKAKQQLARAPHSPGQVEFLVKDMRDKLPEGPFDLVYASLSLSYIPQLDKVIEAVFQVLIPGGTFWIKDGHPEWLHTEHPTFARFTTLVAASLIQLGIRPYLSAELPEMLAAAGFTDIELVKETYRMANTGLSERIALSVILGGFFNFRKMVAQKQNMPEEEMLRMHKELSDHTETLKGTWTLGNVVARRPKS